MTYASLPGQVSRRSQIAHKRQSKAKAPSVAAVVASDRLMGTTLTPSGGPASVAKATGFTPGAVSLWRHRKAIPRKAWPSLMLAYELPLDELVKLEKNPRQKRRAPAQKQDAAA